MLNICLLRALPSPGSVLPGQSGMEHLWGLPVPALRFLSPDTAIAPGIQDCSQPHTWKVFPVPSCPSCCAHQTPPLGDKGQTGDTGKTACVLCPTWGGHQGVPESCPELHPTPDGGWETLWDGETAAQLSSTAHGATWGETGPGGPEWAGIGTKGSPRR